MLFGNDFNGKAVSHRETEAICPSVLSVPFPS
jgi:hypothetical protein